EEDAAARAAGVVADAGQVPGDGAVADVPGRAPVEEEAAAAERGVVAGHRAVVQQQKAAEADVDAAAPARLVAGDDHVGRAQGPVGGVDAAAGQGGAVIGYPSGQGHAAELVVVDAGVAVVEQEDARPEVAVDRQQARPRPGNVERARDPQLPGGQ